MRFVPNHAQCRQHAKRASDTGIVSTKPRQAGNLRFKLANDDVLDAAFDWLCHQRQDTSANNDVWQLRRNWPAQKRALQGSLRKGQYQFDPLQHLSFGDGDALDIWSARDALVLKALQLVLQKALPVHPRCTHVKGHGGLKRGVRELAEHLDEATANGKSGHVIRTDVKSYYASIDHNILLDALSRHIADKVVINLVSRFLNRSVEFGGTFTHYTKGISRGCALSPLLGAFYLREMDEALSRQSVFYIRYMDDIVIVASNCHKLRRAIGKLNRILEALNLEKHPDKTFIGKATRGFDFLGYHFRQVLAGRAVVSVAKQTIANFNAKLAALQEREVKPRCRKVTENSHSRREALRPTTGSKTSRLYEHGREAHESAHRVTGDPITTYINRWLGYIFGGLGDVALDTTGVGAAFADGRRTQSAASG